MTNHKCIICRRELDKSDKRKRVTCSLKCSRTFERIDRRIRGKYNRKIEILEGKIRRLENGKR